MKYFLFFFAIMFFSSINYSQQIYQDVIHLKNGDIAKGIIIENVPNDYVKLETGNGSTLTFKYIDILKFTKEKVSNAVPVQQENIHQLPTEQTSTDLQTPQVSAQQRKDFIEYPSLSLGYGISYGYLGAKFEYKFGIVSIHGGVGYLPSPADYAESAVLFSGGIKFFFSNSDVYLNLQFGAFGVEVTQIVKYSSFLSTSREITQQTIYGPSILLGSTFWFSSTVGLNAAIGGSYNIVEIEWNDKEIFFYALDVGLSIRF